MKVLGIETSCDETAVAVVQDRTVLSNVVYSQTDLHARFGGVVPELASRAHLTAILPVMQRALEEAKADLQSIDCVAATAGPGAGGGSSQATRPGSGRRRSDSATNGAVRPSTP